jgi:hypothetical protein
MHALTLKLSTKMHFLCLQKSSLLPVMAYSHHSLSQSLDHIHLQTKVLNQCLLPFHHLHCHLRLPQFLSVQILHFLVVQLVILLTTPCSNFPLLLVTTPLFIKHPVFPSANILLVPRSPWMLARFPVPILLLLCVLCSLTIPLSGNCQRRIRALLPPSC